ncbi:hypothetical protein SARC_00808 [Sphaeroforma arctica JP610]|uniref:GATA-type domain-containing protein n=1 Tax=Sphaeroforma arctica JP610 TaxID=667725 RepID=A0A0L0GDV5_9EUKA|nr:hypothetical protein SARC_00808 [Sphaeroforma arctica JP610]KNC87064.1 hypothetical protein SARC_00808 [Sphaeroforma arctica JP610]|eukprot:XP_014160966.1 hypothetical protein SARC_00808 [Sphaeroforma arctica JP610]
MLDSRRAEISTYSPSSATSAILRSDSPYRSRNGSSMSQTAISVTSGRCVLLEVGSSRIETTAKKALHTADWVVNHAKLTLKQKEHESVEDPEVKVSHRRYVRKQSRPKKSEPQLGGTPGVVFTMNLPKSSTVTVCTDAEDTCILEAGLMCHQCVAVVRDECAQATRPRNRNRYDSESTSSLRALESNGSMTIWGALEEINSKQYICGIRRGTRDRKLTEKDDIFESPKKCKRYKSLIGRQSGGSSIIGDGTTSTVRKQCASCSTSNTPMWRDSPDGVPYCNACGIRYKKYGVRCGSCKYIPRKEEKSLHSCPRTGCNDHLRTLSKATLYEAK